MGKMMVRVNNIPNGQLLNDIVFPSLQMLRVSIMKFLSKDLLVAVSAYKEVKWNNCIRGVGFIGYLRRDWGVSLLAIVLVFYIEFLGAKITAFIACLIYLS